MSQSRQPLKSIALPCGHFILVPRYQTSDPTAYSASTSCDKCIAGLDPNAVRVRAKAKV